MASFCPSYATSLSPLMIYDPDCLRELRQTGDVKQDWSSSSPHHHVQHRVLYQVDQLPVQHRQQCGQTEE